MRKHSTLTVVKGSILYQENSFFCCCCLIKTNKQIYSLTVLESRVLKPVCEHGHIFFSFWCLPVIIGIHWFAFMCVYSFVSDFLTLQTVCSLAGSSVHRILQARILEWVVIPFSRGSSQPRDWNLGLLHDRQILSYLSYQGSPQIFSIHHRAYHKINRRSKNWGLREESSHMR